MTPPKAHWLDAERLRVYPRILIVMYAITAVALIFIGPSIPAIAGHAPGVDFLAFYVASAMALAGQGAQTYDLATFAQAQQDMFGQAAGEPYGWFYPPTFLLVVTPLALLPYLVSLIFFLGIGLAAWLVPLRRILPRLRGAWPIVLAFPGLWVCLIQGQNGLLTGGLAAGSILALGASRQWAAGFLVGLLAMKPHLALLFVVAFVAAKAWRAILAAALTGLAFLSVSVLTFGVDSITGWLAGMSLAQDASGGGQLPLPKIPTVFGALRLLGAPAGLALGANVLVGLAAAAVVWLIWRRTQSVAIRGAGLMTAAFLATPYCFDYDLVWLAFPIAWLAGVGMSVGWRRWERELLVLAWLLPALAPALAYGLRIQIAPLVLGWLLMLLLKRATTTAETATSPPVE